MVAACSSAAATLLERRARRRRRAARALKAERLSWWLRRPSGAAATSRSSAASAAAAQREQSRGGAKAGKVAGGRGGGASAASSRSGGDGRPGSALRRDQRRAAARRRRSRPRRGCRSPAAASPSRWQAFAPAVDDGAGHRSPCGRRAPAMAGRAAAKVSSPIVSPVASSMSRSATQKPMRAPWARRARPPAPSATSAPPRPGRRTHRGSRAAPAGRSASGRPRCTERSAGRRGPGRGRRPGPRRGRRARPSRRAVARAARSALISRSVEDSSVRPGAAPGVRFLWAMAGHAPGPPSRDPFALRAARGSGGCNLAVRPIDARLDVGLRGLDEARRRRDVASGQRPGLDDQAANQRRAAWGSHAPAARSRPAGNRLAGPRPLQSGGGLSPRSARRGVPGRGCRAFEFVTIGCGDDPSCTDRFPEQTSRDSILHPGTFFCPRLIAAYDRRSRQAGEQLGVLVFAFAIAWQCAFQLSAAIPQRSAHPFRCCLIASRRSAPDAAKSAGRIRALGLARLAPPGSGRPVPARPPCLLAVARPLPDGEPGFPALVM